VYGCHAVVHRQSTIDLWRVHDVLTYEHLMSGTLIRSTAVECWAVTLVHTCLVYYVLPERGDRSKVVQFCTQGTGTHIYIYKTIADNQNYSFCKVIKYGTDFVIVFLSSRGLKNKYEMSNLESG